MAINPRRSRYGLFPASLRIIFPDEADLGFTGELERVDIVQGVRPTSWAPSETAFEYVTKPGDTFLTIASRFYKDPGLWWVLADYNPEVFYPLDLAENTKIFVPPIDLVAEVPSLL